jgi:hypothetical protein
MWSAPVRPTFKRRKAFHRAPADESHTRNEIAVRLDVPPESGGEKLREPTVVSLR